MFNFGGVLNAEEQYISFEHGILSIFENIICLLTTGSWSIQINKIYWQENNTADQKYAE